MDAIELVKKEALRRGYSPRTLEAYAYHVRIFLESCGKEPKRITKNDVREHIDLLVGKNAPGNTINLRLNAIKFLLEEVPRKKLFFNIRYSKVPRRMPEVLTKEEVLSLIRCIKNPKHSLMVKILYSSGMRLSELVNLKRQDLEIEKGIGWVRQGKGRKDRLFIIAEKLREDLGRHINETCGEDGSWVFAGSKGSHLSQRSLQEIIKSAAKSAGVRKDVHPHTLRHSFATHLIEDGYDLASVQMLLGHNSPQTTMIYVHMASPRMLGVKSPYDNIA